MTDTADAPTARQGGLKPMDAELQQIHDERILNFFSRSIKLTVIPLLGVIAAITIVLHSQINSQWVYLWSAGAVLIQIPRLYLAIRIVDQSAGSTADRIMLARLLALCTGLSMGAVVLFAPFMALDTMSLISMILVGTAAASIATCQGYKPLYLTAVLPVLLAIIFIWIMGDYDHQMPLFRLMVILLVVQIGVVFYSVISQVHGFFVQNIVTEHQLQKALLAEQVASSAKTRFFAAASHDLRQPLHAMTLFSAALAIRPLDERSKTIAVKMNEAMKALSEELDSLLDISKLDAGIVPVKRSKVNLSELLNRLAESFRPRAEQKQIMLTIEVHPELYVYTDTSLLGRILSNILDNAVKYTDEGEIHCKLVRRKDRAVISVRDTGIGIGKEVQPHVWEEFYQVDNTSRDRALGLGLGLSVVSRLARLLDTEVDIKPVDGPGTCFEISMAAIEKPADIIAAVGEKTLQVESVDLKGRCVLVVDDDASIRVSSRTLLAELGMEVLLADSIETALAQFRTNVVDCVVMDLRLANGDDGFEAITQLRLIDSSIPVVIMSGDTTPERMQQANSMGCCWLVKPVKPEIMVAEISGVLS